MQAWITDFMRRFGYFAIALLIAVENIFPPIPSEVILTFGGFMAADPGTQMQTGWVIFFATVGSVAGALVLYLVGRLLNADRLERWLGGKWGRILHLKPEDVKRAEGWFLRHGKPTVFFCRFVPIIRSLISIPAGMARMPLPLFLLLTTVGTAIWNTVLVLLGSAAGNAWDEINVVMDAYSNVVLGILIAVVLLGAAFFFFRRRRKNTRGPGDRDNPSK